jgi:DNA-binding transcriptional regulator YiaG
MAPPINPYKAPVKTMSPVLRALFKRANELKIPVAELAAGIGTHGNSLRNWKSGRSAPSIIEVESFAEFIGVKIYMGNLL